MPVATLQSSATGTPRRRRWRKRGQADSPGALQLAEEAFHLLRTTPLTGLWLYFLGTIPFLLAVFYFWADMSRSSHAPGDAALGALGVAAAYFWMKGWQGRFCLRLWEQIHPSGAPAGLSGARIMRYLSSQVFLHAFALPVRLASLIFLGWTHAFFQNVTVLAFTRDYGRRPLRRLMADAARYTRQNWEQNYAILFLMGLIGFFAWANAMAAMAAIPFGIRMLFGVESVFTLNPGSAIGNSTFIFASLLVAFLFVDPMMKAIYTLRCFRAASRSTGDDLISRLAKVRAIGGPKAAFVAAIVLAGSVLPGAHAQQSAGQTPEDLRGSIEETLRKKEYQWRLPRQESTDADAEKNWLVRALTDFADSIERGYKRATDAIERFFRRESSRDDKKKGGDGFELPSGGLGVSAADAGSFFKIVFITLIALLIAWVAWLIFRHARAAGPAVADEGVPAGPIDLESDSIVATQLPEDEWMRLAREQIARGEHRLAIRALFLASLAHLGDRGLLQVARFKSNRDYTRELLLKARALPELRSAFGENVGLFECVWYGLHEASREAIDHFTANYERLSRPHSPVPSVAP